MSNQASLFIIGSLQQLILEIAKGSYEVSGKAGDPDIIGREELAMDLVSLFPDQLEMKSDRKSD